MSGRSTYTDADKARVYVVLQANDGIIKRTARETGVPENTVRRWRDEWKQSEPPNIEEVELAADDFVGEAVKTRDYALKTIHEKIPQANVSQLIAVVGVLDDKIARTKGLGRKEPEIPSLPSSDEIRGLIAGFIARAAIEAQKREAEIIDAEVVEVQAELTAG